MNDLTGRKFNKLIVLNKTDRKTKSGNSYWLCKCACGNYKEIVGSNLENGNTGSCGCLRRRDLTGQKFGRWTVAKMSKIVNWRVYWECVCDCGTIKIIRMDQLISGDSQSCGCYNLDILKSKFKDITNQKFGKLIALEPIDSKGAGVIWLCRCNCGRYCEVSNNCLSQGQTKSCGCWKIERLKSLIGPKHPQYRHDLTEEERKFNRERNYLPDSMIWKQTIKYLDDYTCRKCKRKHGKLNSHHIHNWRDYPDLRNKIDNGVTLCESCHKQFHKLYGNRFTNLAQFEEFLQIL